mmetsp:Transcript_53583/g.100436  ORF Transcript_53583/g.100436 Transcript_53583/m.100436 type:complete len:258 (-) Transcript_53583:48-821(-)
MDPVLQSALDGLKALCTEYRVPESHGVGHAVRVLQHVDKALAVDARALPQGRRLSVRLAALLHDADDRKYFKTTEACNASNIMKQSGACTEVISHALKMIALVSCSANGNSVPAEAIKEPEWLWPRWADRLEATGDVGVLRCWQYNQEVGTPMVTPETPRPTSEAEVWASATSERFERYQQSGGKSSSMLDHYYDKLLRVACPPLQVVRNAYLEQEMVARAAPLVQICLAYGRTGSVPLDEDIIGKLRAKVTGGEAG